MNTVELAKKVVSGELRLGDIRDLYGSDVAELVHIECQKAIWQPITWIKRVR